MTAEVCNQAGLKLTKSAYFSSALLELKVYSTMTKNREVFVANEYMSWAQLTAYYSQGQAQLMACPLSPIIS